MTFSWTLSWPIETTPISMWWCFLLAVSTINVAAWVMLHRMFRSRARTSAGVDWMLWLCAAYVFGCAFRSVMPRADVQRICLFDTWLSSVIVGRTVATVAEVCFAIQCAIALHRLARVAGSEFGRRIALAIVPLIAVAECCSWYAVISTSYLGNAIENAIWALTFSLAGFALLVLSAEYRELMRLALIAAVGGVALYVTFLLMVDVPMYFGRWQADAAAGKVLLGWAAGLHDAATRWVVTHEYAIWKQEIVWMSLYFSAAVWSSLIICGFDLMRDRLPQFVSAPRKTAPA